MKQIVWKSKAGNAVTDTWIVAKEFGKRNANLMKSVKVMAESQTYRERTDLFYLSQRVVPELGKIFNVYILSESGFRLLMLNCRERNPEIMKRFFDAFSQPELNETGTDEEQHEPENTETGTCQEEKNEQKPVAENDDVSKMNIVTLLKELPRAYTDEIKVLTGMLKQTMARMYELECRVDALVAEHGRQTETKNIEVKAIGEKISMNEMAKLISSYGVKIGEIQLYEWMRQNQYLCKYGNDYNLPTQKSMEQGLFVIENGSYTKPTGQVVTTRTTRVTAKGQVYFANKFLYIKANEK